MSPGDFLFVASTFFMAGALFCYLILSGSDDDSGRPPMQP